MAKKDFLEDNPALQFISTVTQDAEPESERKPEPQYRAEHIYPTESRTKRLQLLIQPSLWKKAKAKAKKNHQSLNDYIHTLIENDIKQDLQK